MTSRGPVHLKDGSDIDAWAASHLRRVIAEAVDGARVRVWLFGSRATGH